MADEFPGVGLPEQDVQPGRQAAARPGCMPGLLVLFAAGTYFFLLELQVEVGPTLFWIVFAVTVPYVVATMTALWRLRDRGWWMALFAMGVAAGFSFVHFVLELNLQILLRFLLFVLVLVWLLTNRSLFRVAGE